MLCNITFSISWNFEDWNWSNLGKTFQIERILFNTVNQVCLWKCHVSQTSRQGKNLYKKSLFLCGTRVLSEETGFSFYLLYFNVESLTCVCKLINWRTFVLNFRRNFSFWQHTAVSQVKNILENFVYAISILQELSNKLFPYFR